MTLFEIKRAVAQASYAHRSPATPIPLCAATARRIALQIDCNDDLQEAKLTLDTKRDIPLTQGRIFMLIRIAKCAAAATLFTAAFGLAGFAPAVAQAPSVTKQCGAKWAAAKAAGTTGDLTWPKFLSQCRAEMAAQPPSSAPSGPADAGPPRQKTTAAKPPVPAGNAVFPTAVSSKYSSESPAKARRHTCLDQYRANKATNGNGGLKWIQKGGGYYSQCTKRLKG